VQARSITTIYVTHSWIETQAFAENVAVLAGGQLVQSGSYAAVYKRPAEALVARLTGPIVALPRRYDTELAEPLLSTNGILVRPQQVRFIDPTEDNRWEVTHCRLSGAAWELTLRAGSEEVEVPCSRPYPAGSAIGLRVLTPEASFPD
jgi:ABC-type Fe3+/spermidine/putrescine transport system ATPase subunit